ncbi:MAG: ATP-binding protein [Firmicutes bacterium]|nr:ATP-binding protein [Bacillota bacterium]
MSQIGDLIPVARIVRHGYERYDGFGYPDGLAAEAIPFASRLLSVVRAFEAMTSGRAYRPARAINEALQELQEESARQFDPRVVEACTRVLEKDPHLAGTGGVDEAMEQLRSFLTGQRQGPVISVSATLVGMSSLAQSLSESLSLEATLARVTALVGRLTGWSNLILLAEDGTGTLRSRAHWGFPGASPSGWCVPAGQGLPGQAAWAFQPLFSADYVTELKQEQPEAVLPLVQAGVKAALAIPLAARGRTIGVLCVFKREAAPFSSEQINLLSAVAGEAALALENARLFTEVQDRYAELVTMQAYTNILLRESGSAIIALDAEGRVRELNHAARSLLGEDQLPPNGAVEGRLWTELVEDEQLVRPLLDVLESGQPKDIYGATLFDGPRQKIVDVHISPLRDQTRRIGVVCLAHDVTEHRKMQEHLKQVEKLAVVGELAAGAAHEIRNPLTAVRGFIQLMSGRQASGAADREYVDLILGEIDRIDSILEDLLTLARPTSPNRRLVDLHHILDEVIFLIKAKEIAKGVHIHREWAAAASSTWIDPRQMKQVFLNVLQNAVEAMEGQGDIVVGTSLTPQGEVVVTCRDSGPGIAADVLPRIFDPFFTTKDTGTGLGLAVTFRIVQAHGGRVEAESQAGLGTSFRVTLPLKQSPAAAGGNRRPQRES